MTSEPTILTTTADVIKALGGTLAVANMTGRGYSAVCNWAGWPHFPARTFSLMKRRLNEAGYDAPDSLWAMLDEPAEAVSA